MVGDAIEFQAFAEVFEDVVDHFECTGGDVFEVDALHHLFHQLGSNTLEAERQAHGLKLVLTVGPVHRRDAYGDMAFVVYVFPAFALFGVEDDLLQFLHEGIDEFQRLAHLLVFKGSLQRIDVFVGDEGIAPQRVEDVDRLERIFLTQEGIQVLEVHQAGMLAVANGLVEAQLLHRPHNQLVEIVARQHEQVLGIQTTDLTHLNRDVMDIGEPLALHIDALIHVVGKNRFQVLFDTIAPEFENVKSQPYKCIIAFRMHLFTKEVNQFVLAARDLVHVGGDVTDLAFGSDLVEVDGEDTGELFHLFVIGTDVRVEDLGDLALEEVGVAQEDATQFEVDNQ